MITKKNFLIEYIRRLIHQTSVLVTGGLGFIVAFFFEVFLPGLVIKWVFYLVLLLAGLIIGGYQVFLELVHEQDKERNNLVQKIDDLTLKLKEIEDKRPRIAVRFLDDKGQPTQRLQISLAHLPRLPDFEKEIATKRRELLAKKQDKPRERDSKIDIIIEGLDKISPNYNSVVDEYIEEYRKYLIEKYEYSIEKDRLRSFQLSVENNGLYPANDVTIEMIMPRYYRQPSKRQLLPRILEDDGYDYAPTSPPEPFSREYFTSSLSSGFNVAIKPTFNDKEIPVLSNTSGPEVSSKDGADVVTYKIGRLIQSRPENELNPLMVWLGDVEESTTWEIAVKIFAAELPNPLSEILWIDLKIQEE